MSMILVRVEVPKKQEPSPPPYSLNGGFRSYLSRGTKSKVNQCSDLGAGNTVKNIPTEIQ